MLKHPKNSLHWRIILTIAAIVLSVMFSSLNVVNMKTITLTAEDGLEITADEYVISVDLPYILLFHEQGSSRGEFQSIARRLNKMDYNCLAVDVRNGGNNSYVSNETAKRCRESKCSQGVEDIELDLDAAIHYAFDQSRQPVILFGSGANGSLSLKLASEIDQVRAVVAFSPGEYFLPVINVQDTIAHLKKPIFVTSSLSEFPYVSELVSGVDKQYLSLFEPKLGEGSRGTASLTDENEHNSEYWLALLIFFKDLI